MAVLFWTISQYVLTGLCGALLLLVADFLRRPRCRFISWQHALRLYLTRLKGIPLGALKWRQLINESKHLGKVQERFVMDQIRANADTTYGRDHSFSSIDSLEEFRRSQPLTTYADYEPYIERVARGDYAAMLGGGKTPIMFGCSSGTTGKSKTVPVCSQPQGSLSSSRLGLLYGTHPEFLSADPVLTFVTFCAPRWRYTPDGTRIGPIIAALYELEAMRMSVTLPEAALEVKEEEAATYVGLIFGLRDASVGVLQISFVSRLFQLLQYLEENWRRIVHDLRIGRLSEEVDVTQEVRQRLNKELGPLPERAAQLEREFSRGLDGILRRIFPRLRAVFSVYSGSSMGVYRRRCTRYLEGVPLYSNLYVSTEGLLGLNMRGHNERPGYLLQPHATYLEFLPVDADGQQLAGQGALQASEVQVGGRYEVVVTNTSGFYRYRLGDIVEVVGFFYQVPLIDFLFRSGQLLNVHSEKMTEASFTQALQAAAARWPSIDLEDFTAAESVLEPSGDGQSTGPPHYLLFIETSGGVPTAQQRAQIDEQLCEEHYVYQSFRVKNAIGPMQVFPVAPGTFRQYEAHASAFAAQFKQPRVLRTSGQVEFFLKRRLNSA